MATTTAAAPAAGYGADGVYRSLRPPARIPADPGISVADLLMRRADACPSAPALIDATTGRALTFAALRSALDEDKERAKTYAELLYQQALLIAGFPLEDPAGYTELVCSLMK